MTYYVEAIRYQRESDGTLMTADKRVHVGLTHDEADKLFKRYVRGTNRYWAFVEMKLEDE